MSRRFIVESADNHSITDKIFEIFGSEVKHIQVLRHNVGDTIVINEFVCKIIEMKKNSVVLEIQNMAIKQGEPNINVTLCMAMLKNDKMDFVVQKAVELGVKEIIPFFSKNVIVKLDEKSKLKRKEKLQIIANEACKQCGRTDKVIINDFYTFDEIVKASCKFDLCLFAYENEKEPLAAVLNNAKTSNINNISIIIGAEGGFDSKEVDKITKIPNVKSISLGSRILRAETAALNLASIVMYELDIKGE